MYYFDPQDTEVTAGTGVIVETARGLEYGECVQGNTEVNEQSVVQPLKRMIRIATEADMKTLERNRKRADEAFLVCKRKIEDRGLEMNLVTAECTFDMNKLLFYFTADGRVDFRELVKDLAGVFRTRIELRQIGVRDEAKMIGGLGCCGRELCCSTYLDDFHPVSINMAKDQNLSLNPAKISGRRAPKSRSVRQGANASPVLTSRSAPKRMQILLKPAKMPQQNRARVRLAAARAAAADTAVRRTAKMRLPLRTAPNKKFSTGCGENEG